MLLTNNKEHSPSLSATTASEEQSKVLVHLTPCPSSTYEQSVFACTLTERALNCADTSFYSINGQRFKVSVRLEVN